ncbi:MAG: hypothetical protein LC800_19205, partial [Acidobacteria bacterium]|nr:hypothetical protein [Acidobacteriota bacterium]
CADLNLSLNTGTANWQIVGDPVGSTPVPRAASVVASPPVQWSSLTGAQWIGPNTAGNGIQGNYVYQLCFCLCSGFRNAKLTLIGLADNSATVHLNNVQVNPAIAAHSGTGTLVQTNDPQLFKEGDNCLRVVVKNNDSFTGLNIAGTVTATGGRCNADAQ